MTHASNKISEKNLKCFGHVVDMVAKRALRGEDGEGEGRHDGSWPHMSKRHGDCEPYCRGSGNVGKIIIIPTTSNDCKRQNSRRHIEQINVFNFITIVR